MLEEFHHLGYNAVQSVKRQLTSWRNMLPQLQGQRVSKAGIKLNVRDETFKTK
jgi:hypothetical protein